MPSIALVQVYAACLLPTIWFSGCAKDGHSTDSSAQASAPASSLTRIELLASDALYQFNSHRGVLEPTARKPAYVGSGVSAAQIGTVGGVPWYYFRDDHGEDFFVKKIDAKALYMQSLPVLYSASGSYTCPRHVLSLSGRLVHHNVLTDQDGSALSFFDQYALIFNGSAPYWVSASCIVNPRRVIETINNGWPPPESLERLARLPLHYYGQEVDNGFDTLRQVEQLILQGAPVVSEEDAGYKGVYRASYQLDGRFVSVAVKHRTAAALYLPQLYNEVVLFRLDEEVLNWRLIPAAHLFRGPGEGVTLIKHWIFDAKRLVVPLRFGKSLHAWRAAVFDLLVGVADRESRNYAILAEGNLALIDNDIIEPIYQGTPVSVFYNLLRGEPVPDEIAQDMSRLLSVDREVVKVHMEELTPRAIQANSSETGPAVDSVRQDPNFRADLMTCLFFERLSFVYQRRLLPEPADAERLLLTCISASEK